MVTNFSIGSCLEWKLHQCLLASKVSLTTLKTNTKHTDKMINGVKGNITVHGISDTIIYTVITSN